MTSVADPRVFSVSNPPAMTSTLDKITILCISDVHKLPLHLPLALADTEVKDIDILIISGDLTDHGAPEELSYRLQELTNLAGLASQMKFKYIILIAGNHDLGLATSAAEDSSNPRREGVEERAAASVRVREAFLKLNGTSSNIIYLENSGTTLKFHGKTIKVWGSPYSLIPTASPNTGTSGKKHAHDAFAYYPSTSEDYVRNLWDQIPLDTDILITHGPPLGYLDWHTRRFKYFGCEELTKALWRVKPAVHVFGHIHCGYGKMMVGYNDPQRKYDKSVTERATEDRKGDLESRKPQQPVGIPEEMVLPEEHVPTVESGKRTRTVLVNAAIECAGNIRAPVLVVLDI